MSNLWARSERPVRFRSRLSVPVLAVCVGLVIWIYMNAMVWTPLQRYYWNEYLNTEMFQGPRGDYSMLEIVDRRGQHRMATESDVVPAAKRGRQFIPFVLSNQARQAGAVDLVVDTVHYGSAQMNEQLGQRIYNGQSVTEFAWRFAEFAPTLPTAIPPSCPPPGALSFTRTSPTRIARTPGSPIGEPARRHSRGRTKVGMSLTRLLASVFVRVRSQYAIGLKRRQVSRIGRFGD